ncbi:MAG: hypothetical protein LBQ94_09740 [Treponema sp.]|jgi:hypothetical protein|nr:hypothetical protein [Treponema sp.]
MVIEQTVEIPANHRLVIDVPREVPAGRAVITFTPAVDQGSDLKGECPICAAHRDPVTGNPLYKPEIYASMKEADDMLAGKIPSTLRHFKTFEEMWADLMKNDLDDE